MAQKALFFFGVELEKKKNDMKSCAFQCCSLRSQPCGKEKNKKRKIGNKNK